MIEGDGVPSGRFKSPVLVVLLVAGLLSFGCHQQPAATPTPPGGTADAIETTPSAAEGARREPAAADFSSPTSQPTPVAVSGPTPQRTPTAVPFAPFGRNPGSGPRMEEVIIEYAGYPCGPTGRYYDGGPLDHFLHWTPDGSHLVFDFDDHVWVVDREGTRLRSLVDANPGFRKDTLREGMSQYGFHADVSPDGSVVAYSTCRYPTDSPYAGEHPRDGFGYEIASIGIDGTTERRLTNNWEFFDSHPAWSPDGTKIAFIRSPTEGGGFQARGARIYIMSSDGTGATNVSEDIDASPLRLPPPLRLVAPAWSPDGGRLAFVAGSRVYTVGADGSDFHKIAGTTTAPSWSPTREELAFGRSRERWSTIYTVKPDGTGLQERWRGLTHDYSQPISQVSWSPDGSEFLFVAGGVYIVGADGSGLRRLLDQPRVWWEVRSTLVISNHRGRALAAWSPDGSTVAVYYPEDRVDFDGRDSGGQLFTIARDGTDLRILVGREEDTGDGARERIGIQAWHPPRDVTPEDLAPCRAGPPEVDPGLVQECEAMVVVMNALGGWAGSWWDASKLDLGTWRRVRGLRDGNATGVLPPELGLLTELRELDLSNDVYHRLSLVSGDIPPELGDLAKLEVLNLQEIYLGGRIPEELGNLGNLMVLRLGGNNLSGPIPAELGALKELRELSLYDNNLTGGIPPELGGLAALESLDLSNNLLTGRLPPELATLENLRTLNLTGNDFWGCVPAGLAEIWGQHTGLPRCEPAGDVSP